MRRPIMNTAFSLVLTMLFGLCCFSNRAFGAADWTIMVFMNAKNNLEPDAID